MIDEDTYHSFVLFAPPGTGKTTLAHIIKRRAKKYRLVSLNATDSGVKEVRDVIEGSKLWRLSQSQETILFLDEIHRFSKSQQDVLLSAVEKGEIILFGATTEHPSYELNSALLS